MTIEQKCQLEVQTTAVLAKGAMDASLALNQCFVAYTKLMDNARMELNFRLEELQRIVRAEDDLLGANPDRIWVGDVDYYQEIIDSIDPSNQAFAEYGYGGSLLEKMRNLLVREDLVAEIYVLALFDGLTIARRRVAHSIAKYPNQNEADGNILTIAEALSEVFNEPPHSIDWL